MSQRLFLLLGGAFFFIQFVFFSYLVHKDLFKQFDFDATVRAQDNISSRFDNLFSIFSEVGKFEVSIIILLLILVMRKEIIGGVVAMFLFAGFHVIELFGKFFVDHLPPPQFFLRTKHLIDFPQFHVRLENSYPSGHSGRTALISAILIILIWQNKHLNYILKIVLISIVLCYDFSMMISRVYLGEHWATDVIGGAILGLSFGLLSGVLLIKNKA